MYLLDTNVVSELRKPRRDPGVVQWLAQVPADGLYLSVITIGEIARGIAKQRRTGTEQSISHADALQAWLEGLLADYSQRILPVDVAIATRWGRLCDAHPQHPTDMLIAATALDHGLTVVTRNVAHFRPAGVPVIDPFSGG
ncbi:MAG TPA: type II toxin-antitoxin system VapC family toxin [Longimicrobiales bacterium]